MSIKGDYAAWKKIHDKTIHDMTMAGGGTANDPIATQYKDLLANIMNMIGQQSTQGVTDINTRFSNLGAATKQNLASRGLVNSTILPSLQSGQARDQAGAVNDFNDQLLGRKIDATSGLTQSLLEYMTQKQAQQKQYEYQRALAEFNKPKWVKDKDTYSAGKITRYGQWHQV